MNKIMITAIVLVALVGIEAQIAISDAFNLKQADSQDFTRSRLRGRSRTRKSREFLIQ